MIKPSGTHKICNHIFLCPCRTSHLQPLQVRLASQKETSRMRIWARGQNTSRTNTAAAALVIITMNKISEDNPWFSEVFLKFNLLPFKVLVAAPPPLGLLRAVASRRRKTDELDSVSAQQARARDRMQQVLMSSQKTRQAPPLLHFSSPRAPQV